MLNVKDALRKLAPLRPEEVRKWEQQLPQLDRDTRLLLERKILRTSTAVLGNAEHQLLLSCPPQDVCKGTLELGRVVYEKDLWPFFLRDEELLQHLAIFGRSGSGKTNIVFHLLRQFAARKLPFLFFDWKRTVRHLLPSLGGNVQVFTPGRSVVPFDFNPFLCPPGMERHVHITLVVDLLGRAFTLGDGAKSVLHRALHESAESPTVASLLAMVEGKTAKGREVGWQASAVRCLQTLLFIDLVHGEGRSQVDVVEQFFGRSTVLELNGLNENAKRFLIPSILHWVYQVRLGSPDRECLRLAVVLEEAHHVLHDKQSEAFFGRFLRQCRELGIAVLLVDQNPGLMSSVALGNCFTTIALNMKAPSDVRTASSLLGLTEKDRAFLSRLPVGRGIVKLADRWRSPFVLQFPRVILEKGSMTDQGLQLLAADAVTGSARSTPLFPVHEHVRQVRLADEVLESASFRFLLDVVQHPDAGVKERYHRLGWSGDKGNRIKQQLLRLGLVDSLLVNMGTTRKLVLRPTNQGRAVLGLEWGASIESLAHEFWKRRLAQQFAADGWQVEVEAWRDQHRPELGRADLVLSRDKERWAIEVETGKSNVVENVKNGLRARFDKIVVMATDEKAREKLEDDLARKGLLLRDRVSVQS